MDYKWTICLCVHDLNGFKWTMWLSDDRMCFVTKLHLGHLGHWDLELFISKALQQSFLRRWQHSGQTCLHCTVEDMSFSDVTDWSRLIGAMHFTSFLWIFSFLEHVAVCVFVYVFHFQLITCSGRHFVSGSSKHRIACIPILKSPAFSGSTVEACEDIPAAFVETWNKCQHISIIFHHPSTLSPLYSCLVEPDNAWLLQTARMPQLRLSFANSPCQLCHLHKTSCSPFIIKSSLFVSNLQQALAFLWRARLSELEEPPPLQSLRAVQMYTRHINTDLLHIHIHIHITHNIWHKNVTY